MLKLKNVTKKYGNFIAVDNLNLEIKKERYLVLLVQMVRVKLLL
jgi:ABC-type sugar transport system ATPase subunit